MARTEERTPHERTPLESWTSAGATFAAVLKTAARSIFGTHQPREPNEHEDVRFENSDISIRGVLLFGAALLLTIWIIVSVLYFYFNFLERYRATTTQPALPLTRQLPILPPQPRLQSNSSLDLQQELAHENYELHNYLWVDRSKGIVSIPIDRAMQLIAQRGIPPQHTPPGVMLPVPLAGTRMTGFEGKVTPEPR